MSLWKVHILRDGTITRSYEAPHEHSGIGELQPGSKIKDMMYATVDATGRDDAIAKVTALAKQAVADGTWEPCCNARCRTDGSQIPPEIKDVKLAERAGKKV